MLSKHKTRAENLARRSQEAVHTNILNMVTEAVAAGGKRSFLLLRPGFVKRLYMGYYKIQ
ncbi:MAG: hypothetical protein QXN35_05715 [Ignisphaera sp.]